MSSINRKARQTNILIDLKNKMIADWVIYDVSIGVLFGFKSDINNIIDYNLYNEKLKSLREIHYSYFENEETYKTFKELLKIYIDGVSLYLYKGEVLTYS